MDENTTKMFLQMKKFSKEDWMRIITSIRSKEITQDEFIKATFEHPHSLQYPPSSVYVRSLLKEFIVQLENSELEVHEGIYGHYLELLNQKDTEDCHYCTYCPTEDLLITIKESRNIISAGTTGLTTWQASHGLLDFCKDCSLDWSNKDIIELGSGLGFFGITFIKLFQPKSYTFSDHHSLVLERLQENLKINFPCQQSICEDKDRKSFKWNKTEVFLRELDWETSSLESTFDIIFGADILFDQSFATSLVRIISNGLKNLDSQAILASTIRNEETHNAFIKNFENGLNLSTSQDMIHENSTQPETVVKIQHFMKK